MQTCDVMGQVRDVAEMSNGDVVIAASNGLYHTDATGISTLVAHVFAFCVSYHC